MKKLIAFLLIFLCFSIAACSPKTELSADCPEDFAICFEWGIGTNIYDTYEGKLVKDLITNGSAETALSVDQETLDEIYTALHAARLDTIGIHMDSEHLAKPWESTFMQTPCSSYRIRFRIDGKEYTVTGDETAYAYVDKNSQAKRFCDFVDFMIELAKSTPEYKSLPEAEGGYC